MKVKELLPGWTVPDITRGASVRKYSTTGDILSYKRCKRQYGYFGVRGFSSATATQRYFGTLVHDVLDRINVDYKLHSTLPDETRLKELVLEAHDRLIRSGVRPYNFSQQMEHASKLIGRFVQLLGLQFFPHVQQTEYRLEHALKTHTGRDYILDGVVDVLSGAVSHSLGLPFSTEPDDVEIWDYKSGAMPEKDSREMRDYVYQMRVYSELYRRQTGEYPARAVLAFIGELGDDGLWAAAKRDPSYFPRLVYPIHPNPKHIEAAIKEFHSTVESIEAEKAKPYHKQWLAPTHQVDLATCEACELRFNCTNFAKGLKQRSESL